MCGLVSPALLAGPMTLSEAQPIFGTADGIKLPLMSNQWKQKGKRRE